MVTVNTNGWDLVAAIRQETINPILLELYNSGKLDAEITTTISSDFGSALVHMTLGPPSVDVDTDHSNFVHVTFPITGGSIKPQSPHDSTIIPSSGLSMTVTTDLQYVHLKIGGKKVLRLAVFFTSENAVYKVKIDGNPPNWNSGNNAILESAFEKYMQQQAKKTDYDHPYYIGDIALPDDTPEGLQPTGVADYTTQVVDTDNHDNNIIAMLMVTAIGKKGISNNFSDKPSLIPEGQGAALLISNEILIKKLVVPEIAKALKFSIDKFSFSGGGLKPTSGELSHHQYYGGEYKNGPITIPLNIYIWTLTAQVVSGNAINVDYTARSSPAVDTKEDFYIEFTGGKITITPELKDDEENNKKIIFHGTNNDPKPELHASALAIGVIIAALVLGFGLAIAAVYTAIAAVIIAILLGALTFPINTSNPISEHIEEGLVSVNWPYQNVFKLNTIALPGDLIIAGTLTDKK